MSDNNMILIDADSLYLILSDRAHWRDQAKQVAEAAEAADKDWRNELEDYQALRGQLHALLGVDVPMRDEQLLSALRAKLGTDGLKNGSALASVDSVEGVGVEGVGGASNFHFGPVRSITVDGADISGYVSGIKLNHAVVPPELIYQGQQPTAEDIAVFAAAVGGRAADMVTALVEHTDQAEAEQPTPTETMQPVEPPGPAPSVPVARRFQVGDSITGKRPPMALATPSGEVWDWAGHDELGGQQHHLYANPDRTVVKTFDALLDMCTTLDEVTDRQQPSETAFATGGWVGPNTTHDSDGHDL